MSITAIFTERLQALEPKHIQLVDDSARHKGHAGASEGGGHYTLLVVSDKFAGVNAISRHRMVYSAVADLIPHVIHALSIKAFAPTEWGEPYTDTDINRS